MDKKKILIIDDDFVFVRTLTDALMDTGVYEVVTAEDGAEGLQVFDSENPDLVVLDMLMPKVTGIGFLKKLHSREQEIVTPIIISSNLDSMEEVSNALALGAKGYLVKTDHDLKSIVETIERTLKASKR